MCATIRIVLVWHVEIWILRKQTSKLLSTFFLIKISLWLTSWNARQLKHSYPWKTTVDLQSNGYLHSSSHTHPETKEHCNTHTVGKFVGIKHGRLTKQRYHKGCTVPRIIPHICSWCNNLVGWRRGGEGGLLISKGCVSGTNTTFGKWSTMNGHGLTPIFHL